MEHRSSSIYYWYAHLNIYQTSNLSVLYEFKLLNNINAVDVNW